MKASKFIEKLQKLIDEEGDLEVKHANGGYQYFSEPFSGNLDYHVEDVWGVAMDVRGVFVVDEED